MRRRRLPEKSYNEPVIPAMRRGAILTVVSLCLIAGLVAGQPYKRPDAKGSHAAKESTADSLASDDKTNPLTHPMTPVMTPPRWYAPLKRAEWWLVVGAFFTLFVIGWQAVETRRAAQATQKSTEAIERQARASEDAAKAANRTAESIIKIERAYIDVYLMKDGPAVYNMEVTNCGRTVAKIKEYSLVPKLSAPAEKVGTPYNFEYSKTVYCSKLLEPRDKPWIAERLNLVESLGREDFAAVWDNKRGLAYYGIIRYDDIAGEPHETEFCYYFNSARNYRCLLRVEASEYNKHT